MEFTFTNVDIISDNVGTKGTVFSGLGDGGFFSPTGTLQTNGSGFVFTPGSFVPVSVDPSTVVFDPVTGEAVTDDAVDLFANSGDQVDFNFINGGIDFINPDLTSVSHQWQFQSRHQQLFLLVVREANHLEINFFI